MSTSATSSAPEKPTTYDEMPYPSAAFAQSHPNRLAAMARLFGVAAPDPSKARVLELGCADGSNLLPMADQASQGYFLGIDTSQVQLALGNKAVAAAGLTNVELRHQDILEFPASEGQFDYIIAHGIFSWVPEPVREKILAICQTHLAPTGVAYISYNALPGWNMRRSLRDMMLFHTRGIKDAKGRVQQARALLKFLADSVPAEKGPYGVILKSELDVFSKASDNYFRHDILEEENTAYYFYQFIARAEKNRLQYLSETSLSEMLASNFPETVSKTLAQVGNNIIAQEQYMDFLRNRLFRQTLLCRSEIVINRNIVGDNLRNFAFQSLLKISEAPIDFAPNVPVSFSARGGQTITTQDTFLKGVFATLTETTSRAWAYPELLEAARGRIPEAMRMEDAAKEDSTLVNNLLRLYMSGFVELLDRPVPVSQNIPVKPALSPLTRYQSLHSRYIANRMHQSMPADGLARNIMALCDGTRTVEDVINSTVDLARKGDLHVTESGQPVSEPAALRAILDARVKSVIKSLTVNGFFVP